VLAPVLAIVVFAGGVSFGRAGLAPTGAGPSASPTASAQGPNSNFALIEEAWRALHDNYVDAKNLDDRALAYGAIRGMTDAVGDVGHTSFMTADEVKASDQSLSGSFVGIGVQVTEDNGRPVIGSVIPNTPAEEAGLRRNDRILAVDGKTTAGETIDQTVTRVRGPEGEAVTLTIGRTGAADFDVSIVRRKFDLPLVSWAMAPGTVIAVIRLEQFSSGATKALQEAVKAARADGATSLVFDLRDNPGGYVTEAIGVTSQFLADGIVYQAVDASGKEKDAKIEPGGVATDIPLVVLTNGGTASSAEIVTGAIQDAKRGTTVGEKTFGTGTVLGRFDLADGSSLRIGVERWLTRGGRPIWHEGLDPDITVALADTATLLTPDALRGMTAAELAATTDAQLLRALKVLQGGG
jgi:carboxyl-terminal processing protease